jgi:hypothetical protein
MEKVEIWSPQALSNYIAQFPSGAIYARAMKFSMGFVKLKGISISSLLFQG